jgi:hypothetical protein
MIRDHKIYRFLVKYDAEEYQSVAGTGETARTGRHVPVERTYHIIAKSERKAKAALEDQFQYSGAKNLTYEIVEKMDIEAFLFEPTW